MILSHVPVRHFYSSHSNDEMLVCVRNAWTTYKNCVTKHWTEIPLLRCCDETTFVFTPLRPLLLLCPYQRHSLAALILHTSMVKLPGRLYHLSYMRSRVIHPDTYHSYRSDHVARVVRTITRLFVCIVIWFSKSDWCTYRRIVCRARITSLIGLPMSARHIQTLRSKHSIVKNTKICPFFTGSKQHVKQLT